MAAIEMTPISAATTSDTSADTPTAPRTAIALISRIPHPAKLMGRLAASMTRHEAAASVGTDTSSTMDVTSTM